MGKNLGSTDYTQKAKNTDSGGNIIPYGKAHQLVNQYQIDNPENIHTSNFNYILHPVYIHYILYNIIYNIYYILYNITSHLVGGRKRTGSGIGLQVLNSLLQ